MKNNNLKTTFKSFLTEKNDWTVDYTLNDNDDLNIRYNDTYITKTPAKKWFQKQITGLDKFMSKKYPNNIFYEKDDELLFVYYHNDHTLRIAYFIWHTLKSKYHMNDDEIIDLIIDMVKKYLRLENVVPKQGITTPTSVIYK